MLPKVAIHHASEMSGQPEITK